MGAALDYKIGGEEAYTGGDAWGILPGDWSDSQKMEPFNPAPDSGTWWQNLVAYGATRVIDNKFGPVNVSGNTYPGSLAGQNGRTYSNIGTTPAGGWMSSGVAGVPWLVIGGAALLAVVLLRK